MKNSSHKQKMGYATEQENFWAGAFGNDYIGRNNDERYVSSNMALFNNILHSANGIASAVELGCNIGLNLRALKKISDRLDLCGYEINKKAAALAQASTRATIVCDTIIKKLPSKKKYDLAFTKGVLIHINPEKLDQVYANLYNLSKRYVVVCEYYNPSPVSVPYRGNLDRLFKRDFAGDLMDKYGMKLVDYGFIYHKDNLFPQDDLTWFLLEK